MKDTCDSENCGWLKFIGGRAEDCPNFVLTVWHSEEDKETKSVRDCAPRRTLLVVMDMLSSNIATRQSNEELRNKNEKTLLVLRSIIQQAQQDPIRLTDG
jgi:hypothetical protein